MYIRRKAFSVAIDENGEEKLFSTTEIINEDSYLEKLYAEAEKMSKKEFEKTNKDIKSNYKKGLGHSAVAGVNAYVGTKMAKDALKTKSKLSLAGAGLAAAGTGYHSYKAGKNFKEGFQKAQNEKYQKKLEEEIERQNKKDDKELEKLEKAEKTVKEQKKKLGIR